MASLPIPARAARSHAAPRQWVSVFGGLAQRYGEPRVSLRSRRATSWARVERCDGRGIIPARNGFW